MRVHEITMTCDLDAAELVMLVHTAGQFRSEITFNLNNGTAVTDAKSIMGMMLQPIRRGTRVLIQAKGSDEEEALEAMCRLLLPEKRHAVQ